MKRRVALTLLIAIGACARGEITLPETSGVDQRTVDGSAAFAYVDLSSGATVPQASASTSTTWDIGFNSTTVVVNGGASGPAGVTAFCLCQNASATNDQVLAFSPDNQAAVFNGVTSASIPPATAAWSPDVFATSKWYKYNLAGDNKISPTFDVYLIKRGTSVYKIQLINYYGPAGETRRITFRYGKLK